MFSDAQRGKPNAKKIECMFHEYCESMKVYMLMCLETIQILRSRKITFMINFGSIQNDLEMCPSGKMKALR